MKLEILLFNAFADADVLFHPSALPDQLATVSTVNGPTNLSLQPMKCIKQSSKLKYLINSLLFLEGLFNRPAWYDLASTVNAVSPNTPQT